MDRLSKLSKQCFIHFTLFKQEKQRNSENKRDDVVFISHVAVFIRNVTDYNDFENNLFSNYTNNINREEITKMKKFLDSFKFGMDLYGKSFELIGRH